jgi:hypothetical protein
MKMTENTKLWDILGRTDPKHTKPFTRGGGFKGTALKPMWSYRRLTEEFGPCGEGWGIGEPSFQIVNGDNREILVYCTTSAWYRWNSEIRTVHGVGGDKIVSHIKANTQYNRPERWENDDEAFKKAFTDAVTNAFKLIGVGADIHMGMFDDSKYVNAMREEFSDEAPAATPNTVTGPAIKSSAQLKREGAWDEFARELAEVQTLLGLEKFKAAWRPKMAADGWNKAWNATAKDQVEGRAKAIRDEMERLEHAEPEELSKLPARTALEHSVNVLAGG